MSTAMSKGDEAMGRVAVEILVSNNDDLALARRGHLPAEQVRHFQLQAFVDTAAALLVLPADVADRLGLPKAGEAVVRYADRRSETRQLVEEVRLELMGRHGVFRAPPGTGPHDGPDRRHRAGRPGFAGGLQEQ